MRQPAVLAVLAACNLAVAFGFQWLPVMALGVGASTDAFFVSNLVPQLVLAVIGANLTSVLTPQLSTHEGVHFSTTAWTFAYGLAAAAVLVNGLLWMAAPLWVSWVAPGFDESTLSLTLDLVRIQLVGSACTMLLMATWAAAYARHQFVRVETTGILAGLVALLVAWVLMPSHGVHAVAWALVLRAVLQVAFLVPALGPVQRPDWQAAGGPAALRRLAPLMAGALYYRADPIVERVLASFAPTGQLSILHLAQQAYGAATQIVTRALINPMMPGLARAAAARAWAEFAAAVRRRLVLVLALAVGGWLLLAVAGRPVMNAAFARWLDPAEIALLHAVLIALAGVGVGGVAGQVLTVGFYAYGNTVTPTRVGVIGFTLGILLKAAGFWWGGIVGLAVATSISYVGNACAHLLLLRRDVAAQARRVEVAVP